MKHREPNPMLDTTAFVRLVDSEQSEIDIYTLEEALAEVFTRLTGIEYNVVVNNACFDGVSNRIEIRPSEENEVCDLENKTEQHFGLIFGLECPGERDGTQLEKGPNQ